MHHRPRHVAVAGAAVVVIVALACTDIATDPGRQLSVQSQRPSTRVESFACGVTFTSITYNADSEMAQYGVPARTDTSRVCETWTGSDYRMRVDRIGSSEPASETSDIITTVVYRDGQTTSYLADGSLVAGAQSVGANAFEFGQATVAEQQASYNDPYYGIAQSLQPGACVSDPNATICATYSRAPSPGGATLNITPLPVKIHGHTRRSLRALLSASDEVAGASTEMRSFRSVNGAEETVVTVDRQRELIRTQETRSPTSRTTARLTWAPHGDRYIRDRMEVDGEEVRDGKRYGSKTIVLIQDVRFDPSVKP